MIAGIKFNQGYSISHPWVDRASIRDEALSLRSQLPLCDGISFVNEGRFMSMISSIKSIFSIHSSPPAPPPLIKRYRPITQKELV